MTGSVKPIVLLRRHFRKAMGFAAPYPSDELRRATLLVAARPSTYDASDLIKIETLDSSNNSI
jgi:hypothetical protein